MSGVLLAIVLAIVFAAVFGVLFLVLQARADRPQIDAANKAIDALRGLMRSRSPFDDDL